MAGEIEWELEEGIVTNSRKVFPNVVKGCMTRFENAERGHISKALHCAKSSKRWQVMDGTVVDARKIIHTEFRHFADALKFALSLN